VEGTPQLIELIANQFNYNDSRRIIEVEFRGARREFIEVKEETPLKVRDLAVVETERGVDAGYISMMSPRKATRSMPTSRSTSPVSRSRTLTPLLVTEIL
jgi:hypothetical protein